MNIQGDQKEMRVSVQQEYQILEPETPQGLFGFSKSTLHTLYLVSLFIAWWGINVVYNVYNKYTLMKFYVPLTISCVQMFAGVPYCLFLWSTGLRPCPKLSIDEIVKLIPVALFHLGTHVASVYSLGAGAVSFTHIIKSCEPVFTAFFTGIILQHFFKWQVYVTLLPVMGGVAYASVSGEIGFTYLGFITAMLSNTFSALRGVTGKKIMGTENAFKEEQNMTAANLFGVLTIICFVILFPLTILNQWRIVGPAWEVHKGTHSDSTVIIELIVSSISYYLYNEVAFVVLDNVHPVTHAVGNTTKRVVIIVSAIYIFNQPMSVDGYVGSTIAVLGTMAYSWAAKTYK